MTLEGLFLQILNMSITASYVILAVLLVRLALQKSPKVFSYALWSVAAFRLLCPVSFSSMVSLFHLKPFDMTSAQAAPGPALVHVPADIGLMATPKIASGIEPADRIINGALPAANSAASINPIQFWTTVASFAWLAGFLALLAYGIVSYIKVHRLVSHAVRLEGNVQGNVYEADHIPTPFVLGFIKPRIFLPFRMPSSERAYILMHERHHIRRGDHLIKPLSFLLLAVHWFNPLVWAAYTLMIRDMEMSCDESVLRRMGLSLKRDYSASLLTMATRHRFPVASPLAFGESNARLRVRNVLQFRRPKVWIMAASLVICLAVVLACAANPRVAGSEITGKTATTSTTATESTPAGSGGQSSDKQAAEIQIATDLIRSLLDIPNGQIKAALAITDPANPAAADAAIESAIASLAGGRLSDKLLSGAGTSFRNQVIDFHYQAVIRNYKVKAFDVKVIPNASQKNLYSYEASAVFSDAQETGKPVVLIGRIQFDDSSKVNFISLEGSDYQAIWDRYAPRTTVSIAWMDILQKDADELVTALMNALPGSGATITREAEQAAYSAMYARFGGRLQSETLDDAKKAELRPVNTFCNQYAIMAASAAEFFIKEEEKRMNAQSGTGGASESRKTIANREVLERLGDLTARFGVAIDFTGRHGSDPDQGVAVDLFQERYARMAATLAQLDARRQVIRIQQGASAIEYRSINRYMTYQLPGTLADGGYDRELGYLGGNLFRLKSTGSSVAMKASDSTPPGWNAYGGAEIYYRLNSRFSNGKLIDVFLPWNHSIDLAQTQSLNDCAVPAVITQIGFDLYTAPEAEQQDIAKDQRNSKMWYVFFAKEGSDISYALFLNADHYSKEETIRLARSVKFSADAFNLIIQ